jgi:hypothetical protein
MNTQDATAQSEPNEEKADAMSIRDLMSGKILTFKFFRKQLLLFLLLCGLAIFYIDNKFACEQQIAKINRLKEQLTSARYEALTTSSMLMQLSRQSQVETMIKEKGIDLQPSSEPAILIDENKKN